MGGRVQRRPRASQTGLELELKPLMCTLKLDFRGWYTSEQTHSHTQVKHTDSTCNHAVLQDTFDPTPFLSSLRSQLREAWWPQGRVPMLRDPEHFHGAPGHQSVLWGGPNSVPAPTVSYPEEPHQKQRCWKPDSLKAQDRPREDFLNPAPHPCSRAGETQPRPRTTCAQRRSGRGRRPVSPAVILPRNFSWLYK